MYAIYWHARDAEGNIAHQGHDIAKTLTDAAFKLTARKEFAKISTNLKTFWSCIVHPNDSKTYYDSSELR